MKPKNNSEIRAAYVRFTVNLLVCALITVLAVFSFISTAKVELKMIGVKTMEYDRISAHQIEIVGRLDSLYNYMQLLNTSENINDVRLQKRISTKKMNLLNAFDQIPKKDAYLYRKLTNQINKFLDVNDSIRLLSIEEALIKEELIRCIEDNKQLVRKLSINGIYIDKS